MTVDDIGLEDILSFKRAYRKNRMNAARWVLDHPETLPQLLRFTFEPHKDLSVRASWALEFVFLERPEELWPYLEYFFEELHIPENDSIIRPLAHICERICIAHYKKNDPTLKRAFTSKHKEKLVNVAFDWLITEQKVACEVRAMTCLLHLGKEFDWIHEELQEILLKNIPLASAGYKSRARKTLDEIRKFSQK